MSLTLLLSCPCGGVYSALQSKADATHTHTANQVSGLADVATSGSYTDLSNKPTIYTNVIRYDTAQLLNNTRKLTARSNIGVGDVSFIRLSYDANGWTVIDKSYDIATTTSDLSTATRTLIPITFTGLSTKSAVEEYILQRHVEIQYLYYDSSNKLTRHYSTNSYQCNVDDTTFSVVRDGSILKSLNPIEYITIVFTQLLS